MALVIQEFMAVLMVDGIIWHHACTIDNICEDDVATFIDVKLYMPDA